MISEPLLIAVTSAPLLAIHLLAAVKFNFMSEQQFLEMFTNAVKSEKIRIIVNVSPQQAQAGSGQWNVTDTIVIVNNEQVAKFEGFCELCEPR
jgi:hypothetical protein